MTPLVLASTSTYRRELLSRLGLSFEAQKPLFDEDTTKHTMMDAALQPRELCHFLGREKARSLSSIDNCVIGSDQMLVLKGKIFGKPGTPEKACEQLLQLQGKTHELLTSVSIFFQGQEQFHIDVTHLTMLPLTKAQIENYVQADQALDCAGSYKIEKKGIALFEKIETHDFTAIQGLPLMWVSQILKKHGYPVLGKNPEGH